jgi:hypothetical protein
MKAYFALTIFALTGCVAVPKPVLPFDVARFSGAQITVDDAGNDLTADERSQLMRVLGRLRNDGAGQVRVIPAFSFHPATIAVVGDAAAAADLPPERQWFGGKKWKARYSLTVIDDSKRMQRYAVEQLVGRNARETARRACFGKLLSMLTVIEPRRPAKP